MSGLIYLVVRLLDVYSLIILARAVMSWFVTDPRNQVYRILIRITEPVLGPIRSIIPLRGLDISPLIAILLIDLVIKKILLGLLRPI